ncbi:hypothetical protein BC940DRAFT_349003 [Gongronella butleri]|nr:hypothetical protein BC940DRAFT_349003 [Gongronella butleri]
MTTLSRLCFLLLALVSAVYAYLHEPFAPFTFTAPAQAIQVKRGDTLKITWEMHPGAKFPIYGYAAASNSKTIVGLLAVDATRDARYLLRLGDLKLVDQAYEWIIDDEIEPGDYRIGIGLYYHEMTPIIHVE